ncbi:uncharacterized protein LOC115632628 [Scaptodrosophila lebanonensis]|uniref:Uncharacterized protein LOC115632628 n=1 Tax=Drosophila lebanonensis TaxID=7225 RepID=A0A6J2UE69_DROLE|nr:uncharacterized protein LOC115632628 [Scaptodrosophila lebanonensis]
MNTDCMLTILSALLLLNRLEHTQAGVILHNGGSAVSHQSFTRLSHAPASSAAQVILPSPAKLIQTTVPAKFTLPQASSNLILPHQTEIVADTPTPRILSTGKRTIFEPEVGKFKDSRTLLSYTPAHLTYAAKPVVHQVLPQPKPVRNISYASLLPGPRSLSYSQ